MKENPMAKVSFSIAYDGPALNDGTMDVRDLAPALLAVNDLFSYSSKVLYGNDADVRVKISATGNGSFEVVLDLVLSTWDKIIDMFKGEQAEALERMIRAILGAGTGVFAIYKFLKGRKIDEVKSLPGDKVTLTAGENKLEIEGNVHRIWALPDVQKAVEKLIYAPLRERDGITEFRSEYQNSTTKVSKDEAEYFAPVPSSEEENMEDVSRKAFKIVSPTFKTGNKWQLSDGSSTIYAAIADEDFLDKVENGSLSFTNGDTLVCNIKTIQSVDDHGGLKSKYVVERVVQYIRPPNLPQIPYGESPGDGES